MIIDVVWADNTSSEYIKILNWSREGNLLFLHDVAKNQYIINLIETRAVMLPSKEDE